MNKSWSKRFDDSEKRNSMLAQHHRLIWQYCSLINKKIKPHPQFCFVWHSVDALLYDDDQKNLHLNLKAKIVLGLCQVKTKKRF